MGFTILRKTADLINLKLNRLSAASKYITKNLSRGEMIDEKTCSSNKIDYCFDRVVDKTNVFGSITINRPSLNLENQDPPKRTKQHEL